MAHELNPYEQDEFLILGRFLSKDSYQREKKEIRIGDISVDLIKRGNGYFLAGEVKKSSRYIEAATMQLAYYLKVLREKGIEAKGVLLIPKEKKRIKVNLNNELLEKLKNAEKEIKELIEKQLPPPVKRIGFCKNCAYKEFCFS